MPPAFQLRLYVAGQTAKSLAAIANLKRICETHLAGQYCIEVIDLTKTPQLAAGDQILAVPTLVRRLPEPIKKIIGDLSNEKRVLVGLDIQPAGADVHEKELRRSAARPARWKPPSRRTLAARYVLRLYVTGSTPRSRGRSRTSARFARNIWKGRYDLEVVDISQHPTLAEGEQIIAAPTLIKKLPLPLRRFIGDMSQTERILLGLDLREAAEKTSSARKPLIHRCQRHRLPRSTLLAENAELRARLGEAEEMLRAIRGGDVDALVVEGAAGPQVYTLQGLDAETNRFRGEMLAQVSDAVIAVDGEERIIYLNAAAEQLYGFAASEALGRVAVGDLRIAMAASRRRSRRDGRAARARRMARRKCPRQARRPRAASRVGRHGTARAIADSRRAGSPSSAT